MKRFLIGSFALALIGTSAMAADMVPAPAPTMYDWSGPYIGVQGGFVTGNVNQRIPAYGTVPVGTLSGGELGLYAGVRKQLNPSLVLGAELGANWRFVDGDNLSGGGGAEHLDTKQNWDASLVGKIGIPLNNVLAYGLIGGDISSFNAKYTAGTLSPDATAWGWVAGGGLEAAMSPNLTGRVEYRYTSYGEVSVQCSICGPTFVAPQEHSFTVGLSYRF